MDPLTYTNLICNKACRHSALHIPEHECLIPRGLQSSGPLYIVFARSLMFKKNSEQEWWKTWYYFQQLHNLSSITFNLYYRNFLRQSLRIPDAPLWEGPPSFCIYFLAFIAVFFFPPPRDTDHE